MLPTVLGKEDQGIAGIDSVKGGKRHMLFPPDLQIRKERPQTGLFQVVNIDQLIMGKMKIQERFISPKGVFIGMVLVQGVI